MAITAQAAATYKVSAETLWGIYGTESSFGADPSTSSAGAQGPMQFISSTWAIYGGGGDVQNFAAAMPAAARYLHSLGATSDPSSSATISAVNAYNGNRGGSNPNTSYYQNVASNGRQYTGSSTFSTAGAAGAVSGGGTGVSGTASVGGNGSSGSAPNLLTVLGDLATGDIAALGESIALASLAISRQVAIGLVDLIIAPAWHWNQRAVAYYNSTVLNPKTQVDGSQFQYGFGWTAAFWGLGYVLLFTDPAAKASKALKSVPVTQSRLAHHVRRAQALPARHSLIKPGDVKGRTPKKPKATISSAPIVQVDTMTTSRTRTVKVHGSRVDSPAESPAAASHQEAGNEDVGKGKHDAGKAPQSNARNRSRSAAHESGRVDSTAPASAGVVQGDRP